MTNLEVVEKIIADSMLDCDGFNVDYCEPDMCPECSCLNRLVRHEFSKLENSCPVCNGLCTRCYWHAGKKYTKGCNVCGATGKFAICGPPN